MGCAEIAAGGTLGQISDGHRVRHLYRLFFAAASGQKCTSKTDLSQTATFPDRGPEKGGEAGDPGDFHSAPPIDQKVVNSTP